MTTTRSLVLACVDGSPISDAVADYTAWIARRVAAPVRLLHNLEHRVASTFDLSGNLGPGERSELLEELTELESRRSKILRDQGKLILDAAESRVRAAQVDDIVALQRHGSLVDSLIEMEEEIRVLVLGIRGESHSEQTDQAIGEQLEPVIRALHRPILVVKRPLEAPPQRLMIAYDGSKAARIGLDMMTMSPLYAGLDCHLVQVGKNSAADQAVLAEGEAVLRDAGLSVVSANLTGDTETALLDYQRSHAIDLIVMGAFGHSRLRELLFGSVTLRMLAQSQTPLLLLR
ncbi:universal stress protein [Mangrovimicrobium sediminis]|uniref:Universal stress protein n=1 Tax=Mangrovimicrobium sediminis TaxID=2562682 RepID=A0A4Z0M9G0_9GAMM|nr:universal stress protein [Haliea sp. SAOS-164]TGD76124.1 universal stress protein [Haliea sp. SAOS-164]